MTESSQATDTELLAALRAAAGGEVVGPEDGDYDDVRLPWNLTVLDQRPAAVVLAERAEDVVAAVRVAADRGLGVGVQATGHGAVHPCDGGILINTSRMRAVTIDPDARTATVAAGARWADVLAAATPHGLAPLAGTSPHVGVVGFLLGGGYSWLSRKYGLAAQSLLSADVVTADGRLRTADEQNDPELLWALRGGGGNFGVVTSARIRLFPVRELWAGALMFPLSRAREVLAAYRDWTASVPDEVSSVLALIRLPDMLSSLAPLDGQLVQVLVCDLGTAEEGARRLAPLRALGPVNDTVRSIGVEQIGEIANDSVGPMPINEHGHLVPELSPGLIDVLLDSVGLDAPTGLPLLALRHLGGRLAAAHDTCHGSPPASFLLNASGADLSPDMAAVVDAHQEALSAALAPYTLGGVGLNFIGKARGGRAGDAARTRAAFAPGDYARLLAVKKAHDPDNMFRYNHNIDPTAG